MFKRHMTPLSKGGQRVVHTGKGSAPFPPHAPSLGGLPNIGGFGGGAGLNNYAKATPMAQPTASPGLGDTDNDGM